MMIPKEVRVGLDIKKELNDKKRIDKLRNQLIDIILMVMLSQKMTNFSQNIQIKIDLKLYLILPGQLDMQ